MIRALALLMLLFAAPALAGEGGPVQISGLQITPPPGKPNITFSGTLGLPSVTFEQCDLDADFAPWFAQYATRVDALLRAIANPAAPIGDAGRGAKLRAEANRLEAIEDAAAQVREFHAKMRINE
jgi:hypothetical protein